MRCQWVGVVLVCVAAVLGLAAGVGLWTLHSNAPFPSGVQVAGYSLAGVRPHALTSHIECLRRVLAEQPVVVAQAPTHATKLKDWGVELDVNATQTAIERAWARVPLWQRLFGQPRLQVDLQWAILPELFQAQLQRFRFLERSPQEARVRFERGQIQVIPHRDGLRLDWNTSARNLLMALRNLPAPYTRFELGFTPVMPRIRTEQLHSIQGVISSYTTRFPSGQRLRNHNIRLAANALNGIVLLPGERLSYNQVVGERTAKRGFCLAPVIINGEKRLGIGGGVCQVSSTLFNAALLSGLTILRRANHSIPVDYVPLGRDATVVDGVADLVIANPFDLPIAITTEVKRSSLTIRILGKPQAGRRVVLKTERRALPAPPVKRVPDPRLPVGTQRVLKKGVAGYRVVLWREIYENGRLIARERVATSTYRAQPRVIAVGTRPRTPTLARFKHSSELTPAVFQTPEPAP
ncbi:MAG: VanW family protein [Armatimonadota bacterium]|nr:VanW family protein [Armatimonadota bacterium]